MQKTFDPESNKTNMIIWLALLSSVGMYVFVGITVKGGGKTQDAAMMLLPLAGIAVMTAIASLLIVPRIMAKPPASMSGYRIYTIIRWVLAESVAIYGLVYKFMGGEGTYFYIFVGASVFVFLLTFPNERDYESYERLANQK